MKKIPTLICSLAIATTAMATATVTVSNEAKLFTSNTSAVSSNNPTHRIPAIACKGDTIIAISDERRSTNGGDIGAGRIDLVCRISTDNGKTWGEQQTVAEGGKDFSGNSSNSFGYGDAAVCIDRTTGKILVMAAAGTVGYSSSSASNNNGTVNVGNALRIAKITGTLNSNGTVTWSSPVDMSSKIYGLYAYSSSSGRKTTYNIYVTKAFFGSGRLCQSSLIRFGSGKSYRVYGALTTDRGSLVVYSDDFGETWATLGSASDRPTYQSSNTSSYGDEAKVEELGNGDVLLCAKVVNGSGRLYNIFHYSDIGPSSAGTATSGEWQTLATSTITTARCNGEIYIVPATNKDSSHSNYGKDAYVALLSVPADNTDRKNVSIYWKAINDREDTNEVSDFATADNWTQVQVSTTASAYSTMRQDGNGDIAFLYEENNYAHSGTEAYDIVFKTISLSDITDGKYVAADPWEKRVVTLKAKILKNGATTSYYLRNKNNQDGTASVELEMVNAADAPATLDYSYYWIISKTPQNAANDPYYYLSSFQGDGYLGQVMATDGSSGELKRNGAGATEDYRYEFKVRGFVKKGTQQNGHTDTSNYPNIAVTGYAINFLDLYDGSLMYKNKYIAVSEAGAVNWYDHTTTGENMNGAGTWWTTDFEITDVQPVQNPTAETALCGTKEAPTEYGWPVKFICHDKSYLDSDSKLSFEDANYYATLKLPFAVSLPQEVKAYSCSGPTNEVNTEVGMTAMALETNEAGLQVLPRETPVVLVRQRDADDDSYEAKTLYLRPERAKKIQSTGFSGTLGKRTFTTDEYDPSSATGFYIVTKKGGRVAFRHMSNQTLNGNKAYYVHQSTDQSKALSFVFLDEGGETTGIGLALDPQAVAGPQAFDPSLPVYDLTGRRVDTPAKKGIYVQQGRKFVVR